MASALDGARRGIGAGAGQHLAGQRAAAQARLRRVHLSEPPGCPTAAIRPDAAYFHPELAEFILPYQQVRRATDPDQLILNFYRSTYEIGATLAG